MPIGGKREGAGRKLKYTVDEVSQALDDARGMITIAADMLGCTPKTVQHYIKRYPTVKALINQHRERRIDMAEFKLDERLEDGDLAAIKYVLSTIGKVRGYGRETTVVMEDNRDQQIAKIIDLLNQAEGSDDDDD